MCCGNPIQSLRLVVHPQSILFAQQANNCFSGDKGYLMGDGCLRRCMMQLLSSSSFILSTWLGCFHSEPELFSVLVSHEMMC